MNPVVEISSEAESDLIQIWSFIASDNPVAANELLEQINTRCQSYAHQSELGELRPELGADVRSLSVGWYVVFYRPSSVGIEMIRVIHGARDQNRTF